MVLRLVLRRPASFAVLLSFFCFCCFSASLVAAANDEFDYEIAVYRNYLADMGAAAGGGGGGADGDPNEHRIVLAKEFTDHASVSIGVETVLEGEVFAYFLKHKQ